MHLRVAYSTLGFIRLLLLVYTLSKSICCTAVYRKCVLNYRNASLMRDNRCPSLWVYKNLESSLLLCPLCRIIVVSSPIGQGASQSQVSWLGICTRHEFSFLEHGLSKIKKHLFTLIISIPPLHQWADHASIFIIVSCRMHSCIIFLNTFLIYRISNLILQKLAHRDDTWVGTRLIFSITYDSIAWCLSTIGSYHFVLECKQELKGSDFDADQH